MLAACGVVAGGWVPACAPALAQLAMQCRCARDAAGEGDTTTRTWAPAGDPQHHGRAHDHQRLPQAQAGGATRPGSQGEGRPASAPLPPLLGLCTQLSSAQLSSAQLSSAQLSTSWWRTAGDAGSEGAASPARPARPGQLSFWVAPPAGQAGVGGAQHAGPPQHHPGLPGPGDRHQRHADDGVPWWGLRRRTTGVDGGVRRPGLPIHAHPTSPPPLHPVLSPPQATRTPTATSTTRTAPS